MKLDLDPAALERLRTLGGADLVSQMVRLFIENTPLRIEAALAGERSGDWPAVERAAHSMKSSSAYLGIAALSEQAARIEALAEQGRGPELHPLLAELAQAYPALERRLKALLPPPIRP